MKAYKKVLKNGLRVVVVPMKDNPTVTVMVLVEAGSKYEDKENNGLSHFLEHMCFKGTTKRPNTNDVALELDKLGAEYNAFTSQEYTGYYGKVGRRSFKKALSIVSDLYLNPLFKAEEIDRERGVIIEEINMYEDSPQRTVHDVFMDLLYGGQSAGMTILGPKENIRKFKSEDFREYRDKYYVAEATTVVVAGDVEKQDVFEEVEKAFSGITTSKKVQKKKTKDLQKAPAMALRYKKTDQSHLVVGVRSLPLSHKDYLTVEVLMGILGAGMSSRLFFKLRDEMGVCYYVRAFNDGYTDHGSVGVWAGVNVARTKEVVEVILGEFKKLKDELVSEDELKKVQEYMIGTMNLRLEPSDSLADHFGFQEIFNLSIKTPKELSKEIRAVTAKDVQRLAKKLFVSKNLNLAVVGPFKDKDKESFNNLLKV
ncbi:MAG: hypothetical protein COV70_04000 [Parcubacteria group bacterium CG11_big_fil_rev_8_21_14_0_20_39_22]|nr:MAG: hypothetical protein COV70_04000 [Parcubacteria group bacterium CG11_big_fil_rev_8_21_14_0_20_39_22]